MPLNLSARYVKEKDLKFKIVSMRVDPKVNNILIKYDKGASTIGNLRLLRILFFMHNRGCLRVIAHENEIDCVPVVKVISLYFSRVVL